ncbi:MAG: hypothetical protein INQ03_13780 [Candidatus Heimdallarchaeota archaeon]|nr:hypothetical protein [Candidatus Heimdallarchaeota archaeon]
MRVAALYSFNNGEEKIKEKYPELLKEIYDVIDKIDLSKHKTLGEKFLKT